MTDCCCFFRQNSLQGISIVRAVDRTMSRTYPGICLATRDKARKLSCVLSPIVKIFNNFRHSHQYWVMSPCPNTSKQALISAQIWDFDIGKTPSHWGGYQGVVCSPLLWSSKYVLKHFLILTSYHNC